MKPAVSTLNHPDRRSFLKTMGLTLAAWSASKLCTAEPASDNRPNIIYIMADDHASHALSCYGSRINQTPNLDRLAAAGMRFNNCFCTNAICGPSRAVILTGKYSHINGKMTNYNNDIFDGAQQTFPKLLRQSGYQTAMIGKWHLRSEPTGFDYHSILVGQGVYFDPVFIEMGKKKKHEGYVTDLITDFAMDWLDQRDTDKPFCLMVHHKAPHREWDPDQKHEEMFRDKEFPLPETFDDDYATRCAAATEQEMTIEHHLNTKDTSGNPPAELSDREKKLWRYRRYMQKYLACVASVDDNIGRLLDYLEKEGLADNTIIVYTSDQGFFLGDHGWFDKRFMYEESLRMPLLIRWPAAIKPGSVNDDIVINADFAATLLDAAGLETPSDMQGESFLPQLKGKTPPDWRQSMYYHYYEYPAVHQVKRHYGVRTKRYKLIHYYYDIDCWEMFDLEKDPHELNNLYGNPEHQQTVRELKKELRRLQAKYQDSDELARKLILKQAK